MKDKANSLPIEKINELIMQARRESPLPKSYTIDELREKFSDVELADMLLFSDQTLRNILSFRREYKLAICLYIIARKPKWKETGDPVVDWDDVLEFNSISNEKWATVKKKLHKRTVTDAVVEKLHDFLVKSEEIIY